MNKTLSDIGIENANIIRGPMCMCVCERERERERGEWKREKLKERIF